MKLTSDYTADCKWGEVSVPITGDIKTQYVKVLDDYSKLQSSNPPTILSWPTYTSDLILISNSEYNGLKEKVKELEKKVEGYKAAEEKPKRPFKEGHYGIHILGDTTANNTQVLNYDGTGIPFVQSVNISIEVGKPTTATLVVANVNMALYGSDDAKGAYDVKVNAPWGNGNGI